MKKPRQHKSTIIASDNWKLWNQVTATSPIPDFILHNQTAADVASAFHDKLHWLKYYRMYLMLHSGNKLLAIHRAKSHAALERVSKLRDQPGNSEEVILATIIPRLKILVNIHEDFKIDRIDSLRRTLNMIKSTSLALITYEDNCEV